MFVRRRGVSSPRGASLRRPLNAPVRENAGMSGPAACYIALHGPRTAPNTQNPPPDTRNRAGSVRLAPLPPGRPGNHPEEAEWVMMVVVVMIMMVMMVVVVLHNKNPPTPCLWQAPVMMVMMANSPPKKRPQSGVFHRVGRADRSGPD